MFRFDIGDTGGGGGHEMAPCVIVLSRVLIAPHLLLIPKLDFCKFIKLHFLSGGDGDLYHLNQPKGSIGPAMNQSVHLTFEIHIYIFFCKIQFYLSCCKLLHIMLPYHGHHIISWSPYHGHHHLRHHNQKPWLFSCWHCASHPLTCSTHALAI